jgi:hypothetical protein
VIKRGPKREAGYLFALSAGIYLNSLNVFIRKRKETGHCVEVNIRC